MTTTLPKHLAPVLRHVIVWEEGGEERRRPFHFKSDAVALQRELDGRGIESRRLKV
jgi:hypothetical protein